MPKDVDHHNMATGDHFAITWFDRGREPECPPDPAYPNGIDIVAPRQELQPSCTVTLPYPARRCGFYCVDCVRCEQRVIVTTAGRPDDPRSLTLACRPMRRPE